MKRYFYSLGAVLLLGGCVPAMAQGYYGSSGLPVHWYVDGGYSVTTGQTSNYLENGWNIGGGVEWSPAPGPFALRADLNFNRFNATNQLLALGAQQNQTALEHRKLEKVPPVNVLDEFVLS